MIEQLSVVLIAAVASLFIYVTTQGTRTKRRASRPVVSRKKPRTRRK